jgi:hypothetical protein
MDRIKTFFGLNNKNKNLNKANTNVDKNAGAAKQSPSSNYDKLDQVYPTAINERSGSYIGRYTVRQIPLRYKSNLKFNRTSPTIFLAEVDEEYYRQLASLEAESATEIERVRRLHERYEADLVSREEETLARIESSEAADLAMEEERRRRLTQDKPVQHPFLSQLNNPAELASPSSPGLSTEEEEDYLRIINMETASNIVEVEKSARNKEEAAFKQFQVDWRIFESRLSAEHTGRLEEIERQRLLLEEWRNEMQNEYERIKSGQEANFLADKEQRHRIQEQATEREAAETETRKDRLANRQSVWEKTETEREERINQGQAAAL